MISPARATWIPALAIDDMIEAALKQGRHVLLSGIPPQAMRALDGMGVLDRVPADQRFENRSAAIESAAWFCRDRPQPGYADSNAGN